MKDNLLFLIIPAIVCCIGVLCTALFWQPDLVFVPVLATLGLGFCGAFLKNKKEGPSANSMWYYLNTLFGTVGGSLLPLLIWFIFFSK